MKKFLMAFLVWGALSGLWTGAVAAQTSVVTEQSFDYSIFDRVALEFEKYLKVGSGHAFAQRRLW